MTSIEDINNRFNYHKPDPQRAQAHDLVRGDLADTAHLFDEYLPDGREKALAITKLEEAMFWANAAIARQGEI